MEENELEWETKLLFLLLQNKLVFLGDFKLSKTFSGLPKTFFVHSAFN
jgi:hypothetical protein